MVKFAVITEVAVNAMQVGSCRGICHSPEGEHKYRFVTRGWELVRSRR